MIAEHQRVLVLGATGFLGTHVVQTLLARGHSVTALVRGKPHDSEFVRRKLFEQVRIVGCDILDMTRLRQIIGLHEITAIIQAAATDTIGGTHALTHSVLTAVAHSPTNPMVIVPLRASDATPPRFETPATSRLNAAFVRLPELFGPGESRPDRWITRLFLAAARIEMLPRSEAQHDWLDAATAADHLVNCFYTAATNSLGRWVDAAAAMTTPELIAAVRRNSPDVVDTIEWYRENADRIAARMPAMRAAA